MDIKFNYDKLRGRVKEYCKTNREFAKQLGVSEQTIQKKLNCSIPFTQKEIYKAINTLCINNNEIASIFFTIEVENN